MAGPSPYRHWEYKLRQERERQPSVDKGDSWRERLRPFFRAALLMFGFGSVFVTLRYWAITYGSC